MVFVRFCQEGWGKEGGGVVKIVKYGWMTHNRQSNKRWHKLGFEQALFKYIVPQLLYGLPMYSPAWKKMPANFLEQPWDTRVSPTRENRFIIVVFLSAIITISLLFFLKCDEKNGDQRLSIFCCIQVLSVNSSSSKKIPPSPSKQTN